MHLATASGPVLTRLSGVRETVVANIEASVAEHPEGVLHSYEGSRRHRSQTHRELWQRSSRIAAGLQYAIPRTGTPVGLLIKDVVDCVPAFWACLRAGMMAVPLAGVAQEFVRLSHSNSLRHALAVLDEPFVIVDEFFADVPQLLDFGSGTTVLPLEQIEDNAQPLRESPPSQPLYLVPTSGSTGSLKLVALDHACVLDRNYSRQVRYEGAFLNSFPFDSTTGLQAIFPRHAAWVQMPLELLIARPLSLFDAIEEFQISGLQITNSLAAAIVMAHKETERRWKLSCLRQVGIGAEPVSGKIAAELDRVLTMQGANSGIIRAGYGTTETGVLVTGANPTAANEDGGVALGACMPGVSIRIVDDRNRLLTEGEAGQIQVLSPQRIFSQYWKDPAATRASFTEDGWWRTGDLGSLREGELTVRGRAKELFIAHGRKYSLSEIDEHLQTIGIGVPAFAVVLPPSDMEQERLVVAFVATGETEANRAISEAITAAIVRRFGVRPATVVGVRADLVSFTPTGKLRRAVLTDRLRSALLALLDEGEREPVEPTRENGVPTLEVALFDIWTEITGAQGRPDIGANFFDLGGDSIGAIRLFLRVEEAIGRALPAEEFYREPTFEKLLELARIMTALPVGGRQSDRSVLIRELEIAHSKRLPVEFDRASPVQWAAACHALWDGGRVAIAEHTAVHLQARYPEMAYFAWLTELFRAVPTDMPLPIPFTDRPEEEIQCLIRPNCRSILLVFCAREGTLGHPLNFVHQWLGRLPASLIYIKDVRNLCGAAGFSTLGPDRASSVVALREMIRACGAERICTLGVSMGGYAALSYGLDLGARAALCLAGATDLTPEFMKQLGPLPAEYIALRKQAPDYLRNLRDAYAAAEQSPAVMIAYSAGHDQDRMRAMQMAGLPNVEILAVDHAAHNVVDPLIRRKMFLPLLQSLLTMKAYVRESHSEQMSQRHTNREA